VGEVLARMSLMLCIGGVLHVNQRENQSQESVLVGKTHVSGSTLVFLIAVTKYLTKTWEEGFIYFGS
jgi:hypothetical protein